MSSLFGTVLLPVISRYLSSDNIEDKIERVNFSGQPSRVSVRGRHQLDQVIKLFDLGSSYQNFDPRTEINFFFSTDLIT